MSTSPIRSASNREVNEGSILLVFNDVDTDIIRSWRIARTMDPGTSPTKPCFP